MRSIASQSEAELGGPGSILVRQRQDHIELDGLIRQSLTTEGDEQRDVLTRMWRLVFPHAFAEEAVLWPAARKALPDGEALTLRIEQEHQDINAWVSELERMPEDDPARRAQLERIVERLQHDVRDEEDVLLPRLQEALDEAALRRLGRSWELVRRVAPTRPHAVVARRPPGNVLAALPLTALDRSRDRLDVAARRSTGPLSAAARRGSGLLAGAAGALEHLPPFRAGEDRSTAA